MPLMPFYLLLVFSIIFVLLTLLYNIDNSTKGYDVVAFNRVTKQYLENNCPVISIVGSQIP